MTTLVGLLVRGSAVPDFEDPLITTLEIPIPTALTP